MEMRSARCDPSPWFWEGAVDLCGCLQQEPDGVLEDGQLRGVVHAVQQLAVRVAERHHLNHDAAAT